MQHESEEFEVLTTLKVSDQVTTYDDILSPNMDTIRVNKMLEEEIYNLFLESPFKSKYSTWRKVDKKDVYNVDEELSTASPHSARRDRERRSSHRRG